MEKGAEQEKMKEKCGGRGRRKVVGIIRLIVNDDLWFISIAVVQNVGH